MIGAHKALVKVTSANKLFCRRLYQNYNKQVKKYNGIKGIIINVYVSLYKSDNCTESVHTESNA